MRGVPLGDDGRGEEASDLAALFIVQGTVGDEDRVVLQVALRDRLGGEARLGGQVAGAEHLTGGGDRTDPPDVPLVLHAWAVRFSGPAGSTH